MSVKERIQCGRSADYRKAVRLVVALLSMLLFAFDPLCVTRRTHQIISIYTVVKNLFVKREKKGRMKAC